jgi:hypothetical protein
VDNRGRSLISTIASVLARAGAWLDRAAFNPASLPDDLTMGIALAPPVAAGLIIFKLPAVEMLAAAIGFGAAGSCSRSCCGGARFRDRKQAR